MWDVSSSNAIKHCINDPRKGDKGFTPEVFEHEVVDEFIRQTNIDLKHLPSHLPTLAKELLPLLLQSSKEVVADAQFVINQRGIGFKNFVPATFGSQAARKFSNRSHVKIKQTALNPRNLKNTPDAYEENVLKRLATQPASDTSITEWIDNGDNPESLNSAYIICKIVWPVMATPKASWIFLAIHGRAPRKAILPVRSVFRSQ